MEGHDLVYNWIIKFNLPVCMINAELEDNFRVSKFPFCTSMLLAQLYF